MTSRRLSVSAAPMNWAQQEPFSIAGYTWTALDSVTVTVSDGDFSGRGEGAPIFYYGETGQQLLDALNGWKIPQNDPVEARRHLLDAPLPMGARNALDCALWDLQAKQEGKPAYELAGMETLRTLTSVVTVGMDTPDEMHASALRYRDYPVIKVKLGSSTGDDERLRAVHAAVPDARLLIDANCGWSLEQLNAMATLFEEAAVDMVEQPLPASMDDQLSGYIGNVPLCADESCQTASDLPQLEGLFEFVNIKLDKTGGLTPALALVRRAEAMGFQMMVGNMLGTSLAMAPAYLIGQFCRYVDIDGPLLLTRDYEAPLRYEGSSVSVPTPALWG